MPACGDVTEQAIALSGRQVIHAVEDVVGAEVGKGCDEEHAMLCLADAVIWEDGQ